MIRLTIRVELVLDYSGTQAPSGVEGSTCIVYTEKLSDEQSKSNADRSDESSFVLFGSEKENSEHEERSQEHFQE